MVVDPRRRRPAGGGLVNRQRLLVRPARVKAQAFDVGKDSGPHYIALSEDEERLVITDYFLNEDRAGKVHAEGDHRVHAAKVSARGLALDPRFRLDFNALAGGPARPHGVLMK